MLADSLPARTVRVIGPGPAGRSLAGALTEAGWVAVPFVRRGEPLDGAAAGVDALVIATPDDVVREVAGAVRPVASTAVLHLSGSLGLDALAPHPRRGSVHPLVALPDAEVGAMRLRAGSWFAVSGDRVASEMVAALGGRALEVPEEQRVAYHAAAVIASNHLVALLGQVARVAAPAGVPLDAYLDLVRATVENVAALGPHAALTGPVARGDLATVARHLEAIDPVEHAAYEAMAAEAARLARERRAAAGEVPV